jgi:hypothetical protein
MINKSLASGILIGKLKKGYCDTNGGYSKNRGLNNFMMNSES